MGRESDEREASMPILSSRARHRSPTMSATCELYRPALKVAWLNSVDGLGPRQEKGMLRQAAESGRSTKLDSITFPSSSADRGHPSRVGHGIPRLQEVSRVDRDLHVYMHPPLQALHPKAHTDRI